MIAWLNLLAKPPTQHWEQLQDHILTSFRKIEMLKKHCNRNRISLTSWHPGPGLAMLGNDTEAAIYCFVYVFACLSKCNIWSSLQGIWKTLVLIHTGRDSEKKAACR